MTFRGKLGEERETGERCRPGVHALQRDQRIAGAGGARRSAPTGGGGGQAGEDDRRARALRDSRGAQADGPEARGPARARSGRSRRAAHCRDGRAGHRRRSAEHQSLVVQGRARPRGRGRQDPERGAGGLLRDLSRSFRRLRFGCAAVPRPGRRAARARREEARVARRGRRGERRQRRVLGPEIPSRSGRRPRSWAFSSSSTRRARRSSRAASRATAGSPTPSATRSIPPSRSRISSSRALSTAFRG